MAAYTELLSQLEDLNNNPPQDEASRKVLLAALRQSQFAVERAIDVVHRLSFSPLQSSVARVASDLDLFELIANVDSTTVSLNELAAKTGAKPLLIRRILRFLTCQGLCEEPQPGIYAPTPSTIFMADPGLKAGLKHNHDVLLPCWAAMPKFLRERNFDNIDNVLDTPFQIVNQTDLPPFAWAMKPENIGILHNMNLWMAALRDISPSWLDIFPSELLYQGLSLDTPFFVDIGGGLGHQCQELKIRYPQILRPIILQDLPPAISHALTTTGVVKQVYDFFDQQPVHNARFYYLKSVLHDWPDDKVVEILENQILSMSKESRILVDEIVLPETGAHWRATELDLALMPAIGSIERTQSHWKELLKSIGLLIEQTLYYDYQMMYAVQIVRLE